MKFMLEMRRQHAREPSIHRDIKPRGLGMVRYVEIVDHLNTRCLRVVAPSEPAVCQALSWGRVDPV